MAHTVVIYDNNIVRLIQFGDGAVWTRNRAWEIRALAVVLAPMGTTGQLKASHIVTQNRDAFTGRFRKGFTISATARHARWVHEGTGLYGPQVRMIVPKRKKAMTINDGLRPRFIKKSRGQRGQEWLKVAGETVARRY